MIQLMRRKWEEFERKRPNVAQFGMFFLLSNGVTVLQLALMPLLKAAFNNTLLVDKAFQIWPIGSNVDGSQYFIFDYPAGELPHGGGGLAYFLAVQITIGIAQIINFFAQRRITFRANNSIAKAASWYVFAYILITIGAAAAQGFYKAPIYNLFIDSWGWGSAGETAADVITMIINSAIAFWIFFPIFKVIFKREPEPEPQVAAGADQLEVEGAAHTPDVVVP